MGEKQLHGECQPFPRETKILSVEVFTISSTYTILLLNASDSLLSFEILIAVRLNSATAAMESQL